MKHFQHTLILLAFFLILAAAQKNSAATFTVTNTNDSGEGSLRQALITSNTNNQDDTINFDQSVFNTPQTITLTGGQLVIEPDNSSGVTKVLTINGTGANLLTISGNNQSRVIFINRDTRVVINKVKITGGNGIQGGGIFLDGGYVGEGNRNLILSDSIVSGNTGNNGGGLSLGGYEVLLINTTISDNSSITYGGGIYIPFGANLRMINSTISKNTAGAGGGVYSNGANLYLTNCTVAFNRITLANSIGGGIFLGYAGTNFESRLFVKNTIIAKNIAPANSLGIDVYGNGFISQGYNIVGNTVGGYVVGAATDQLNVDPSLDAELKNNGGWIPTHALSIGSSAVDRGSNCVLTTIANGGCLDPNITADQRGVSRPQDGNSDGTATVDIGAFEVSTAEILTAPNAPDLRAVNDTGTSNTDNITRSRDLTFDVSGLTVGATVEISRDGTLVNSIIAEANAFSFTDNNLPADGRFVYSVRQTVNGTTSLQNSTLVVIDNTAPTVTINQAVAQLGITRNQPINFTVVFSEPLPGFEAADVTLNGSTAGVGTASVAVTGSGTTYNAAVSGIIGDGDVRASILPNAVQDLAGNASAASTSTDNTVVLDTTPPTVTINQAATQTDPTRSSQVNFTVVFSEIVNTFSSAGIQLLGSTANISNASIVITGSGTTYNVAVNNISSNGGFVRAIVVPSAAIDLASNPNDYSTSTDNTVTVDNISPTVTINQAVGQSDPTGTLPVNYTVVFSEAVTGFDNADVSLSGSSISTTGAVITVSGSGTTYNVAVSNLTANNGFVRATVRSGAALDAVGNSSFNSTSTDNTVTVDNVAPTVSINQSIGQSDPASAQPINFTVVFNELVTGLTAADITLAGSTANVSAANIVITGNGSVYNVAVSNITSNGQVRASVVSGAAQDAVGNLSSASTSSDNVITVNAPRVGTFDFDGDGKSDISVFRPETGTWYLNQSTAGFTGVQFGLSTDKLVPADYDGDGKTDVAVYRGGTWYLQRSQLGFAGIAFGASDDIPVPADYDGDGKADLAVFRPSNGTWYLQRSSLGFTGIQFGQSGDKPVAADYDGDGKADVAVNRNGTWYLNRSTLGFTGIAFGDSNDKLVPADYDGDGKADIAVFRPSNGTWYLQQSSAGFAGIGFGVGTDIPTAADYDGDGKADLAVFRNGVWYLNRTTAGFTGIAFGAATDKPIPNVFVQ
jgi:FG-GAP-like repeat/Bacterial Ig-like domain